MATFRVGGTEIICASEAMRGVRDLARRAARTNDTLLITGESGVGKEVVARYVHEHSSRAARAFVAVNCVGLHEIPLESELFGHRKGSFRGAYRDKVGHLELAHRGTVYLNELGALTARVQALLVEFLDCGEIQPLGNAARPVLVDVRMIAATNRDLTRLAATGDFLEDLLHRVRIAHIHVPPLRDRRADIRPLIAHFISRTGRQLRFSETALRRMEAYDWPGNVRELHIVVDQASWIGGPHAIGPEHLTTPVLPARKGRAQIGSTRTVDALYEQLASGGAQFWESVYTMFIERDLTREDVRELVRRGLTHTNGNYRALLPLFGIPPGDYKRFLNFLATHDCAIDYRGFRRPRTDSRSRQKGSASRS